MKKTLRVVAAIIEKEDKILIARRLHGEFEGLWEFPGGKYEGDETGPEALKREIEEEFEASINIKELLCKVIHEYEKFTLEMDCYICELTSEELRLHDHSAYKWIDPKEKNIEWVPADKKVIGEYLKKIKDV